MFKKTISLLLCCCIIVTMGLCLCSCKGEKSDEYPVTIGDVTIEKEPLNIVVLSDCLADVISYIGYDVKMVGRSIECDQEFLSIVPIVGTAQEPNVDSIVANEADLVIIENPISDSSKQALDEAQIPVVTLKKATTFEELKVLYTQLGSVLGGNVTGKEKGVSAYDELTGTMSDFENAVPSSVVKTACYLYLNEDGALCTLTKGSIEYELFGYCAAINVLKEQEAPEVDLEQLKISTPSYIFYDDEAVLEFLKADAELSTMGALTSDKTYQVKKSDFNRQGTTYEELVYHIIDFMFGEGKTTPDEATPDNANTVGFVSE